MGAAQIVAFVYDSIAAEGTAGAAHAAFYRGFPFVAVLANPPDLAVAAGTNFLRRQVGIFLRMPLAKQLFPALLPTPVRKRLLHLISLMPPGTSPSSSLTPPALKRFLKLYHVSACAETCNGPGHYKIIFNFSRPLFRHELHRHSQSICAHLHKDIIPQVPQELS